MMTCTTLRIKVYLQQETSTQPDAERCNNPVEQ